MRQSRFSCGTSEYLPKYGRSLLAENRHGVDDSVLILYQNGTFLQVIKSISRIFPFFISQIDKVQVRNSNSNEYTYSKLFRPADRLFASRSCNRQTPQKYLWVRDKCTLVPKCFPSCIWQNQGYKDKAGKTEA